MKLLLLQAQQSGTLLAVDTNQLENELMLRDIAASESLAVSRPASDFMRKGPLRALGAVATISVQDPAVAQERDELKEDVASLRDRVEALQTATTTAMRDKSSIAQQRETAQASLRHKESELATAKSQLDDLARQLQQQAGNRDSSGSAAAARQLAAAKADALSARSKADAAEQQMLALLQANKEKEAQVRQG